MKKNKNMSKLTIVIIVGVLILGVIVYSKMKSSSQSNEDEMFISTQGQSLERVSNLGLDGPSEDASHILDEEKLSFPKIKIEERNEFKANPEREWIINLIQVDGGDFKKEDISKMFDYEWRSNFRSTLFGFSPEENIWTYADAGGSPEVYSKLQVAIDVQGVYNDEQNYSPEKLQRYLTELRKRIQNYPTLLELEVNEPIAEAILKAKNLVGVYDEFNSDEIIVLQSEQGFKGVEVWDVLQSVGLKWGDMDLFHWSNYKSDYGHDQHFSVWTATSPGYFFPEEIKNGNMNPENLIFGFSVPRSADPVNVQKVMIEAVKYCQKRLGGEILNRSGNPFKEKQEIVRMIEFVDKMKLKGLIPGSDNALIMF